MRDASAKLASYLKAKAAVWSKRTLSSERSRLTKCIDYIDGNPETLLKALKDKAPYTLKTTWIRVTDFWDSQVSREDNPYREFTENNPQVFRNYYIRKLPEITYEQVRQKINSISDEEVRAKALQLLDGGLRYTESLNIDSEGMCLGKGNKKRKVFVVGPVKYTKSKTYFAAKLKEIGLKPHDLRKIRATQLARKGMKEQDLCKVFGWSSFQTAANYLAPMKDDEIEKLMEEQ